MNVTKQNMSSIERGDMMNYEAYCETKDVVIYYGAWKSALIQELADYIVYQNHINENDISEEEI
ncbi:hypothetical protein [Brevibacillus laterosporus]|uniref:hypothetical protein n=1 Tax=Brevibacillus laterosporus TaxID=1465 RepID=UPI0013C44017|nr:hypothetical protein [Brevibacillus laterosporus]MBM7111347.1 hypothetical protein [Brevibacillus laterosporus]